jgi:hypothetical protein
LLGVPYADHDFFQANSKALITRTATPEQNCPQKVSLRRETKDTKSRDGRLHDARHTAGTILSVGHLPGSLLAG